MLNVVILSKTLQNITIHFRHSSKKTTRRIMNCLWRCGTSIISSRVNNSKISMILVHCSHVYSHGTSFWSGPQIPRRGISWAGHTFMATSRPASKALFAASSSITPICSHTLFAPTSIASSTTPPASSDRLFYSKIGQAIGFNILFPRSVAMRILINSSNRLYTIQTKWRSLHCCHRVKMGRQRKYKYSPKDIDHIDWKRYILETGVGLFTMYAFAKIM